MEGEGILPTEDNNARTEGADGGSSPTTLSVRKDSTTQGTDGSPASPSPEGGIQVNDEESIASTETTLTTKADREVQELMKSVISSSETTSVEDQSSFTQDGSDTTEIHVPYLDISFEQSETGSVIVGQNARHSDHGSVIEVGVVGSENGLVTEIVDQSDERFAKEAVGDVADNDSGSNKLDSWEDKLESSTTNRNLEDSYHEPLTSDHSGLSAGGDNGMPEEGGLIHREAVSPVLITPPPDGTVSQDTQVQDGNISSEQPSQEKSADNNVSPVEEITSDDTMSNAQGQERSENGTPLSLLSQQNGEVGQDEAQQSLNSVSDTQLEEYDSMSSFSQHKERQEEDLIPQGQFPDGTRQADNEHVAIGMKDNDVEDVEERSKDKGKEVADDSEEEDSSQFAQLIVQHVLGHAVSSFNESDTSIHDDTTEAGSQASLPTDGDVKPAPKGVTVPKSSADESVKPAINVTITSDTAPLFNQATHTKERTSERHVSLDQCDVEHGARSLTDIQIDNSTNFEDSSGGSGLEFPKRSNITLDSEMENETFDISLVSGESTQTDNPERIVIHGKGTPKYTVEDTMSDTDCRPQGLRMLAPLEAYPEFPENYGNYEVCRTVGPNEKECLVLETGENITVKKNVKISKKSTVKEIHRGNIEEFPLPNVCQSSHPRDPVASDGSRRPSNRNSSLDKISREKGNIPVYTSMSREEREVTTHPVGNGSTDSVLYSVSNGDPSVLTPQQNGKPVTLESCYQDGRQHSNGNLTSDNYRDQLKNQVTDTRFVQMADGDVAMDQGDHRQYSRYGSLSQQVSDGVQGHNGYHGDNAQLQPQLLNSEIFQDPVSLRLSQNSKGGERIDHRILQSSSLYTPGSGLTSLHVPQDQCHKGQSSRSQNDIRPDRQPTVSQLGHQSELSSELPRQDTSTQHRGPLITEEDLQRYNVNFTDPRAYQRYQQVLARENSTGETYAKFPSEPQQGQSTQQEPPIDLVDSIYNRVLRNEDSSRRHQLPQGAFEGSYLDTRNDPTASADLTETEKALLSRIYREYGAEHLHTGVPQWPNSLINSQAVQSSHEVSMSTPSSGPIPNFKTLQEQQTSWMQMFKTLEEKHEQEMKHQRRQHKDTIFEMQQKMESELFDQQQQLRHKLKIHKQALEDSSFNNTTESQVSDIHRSEMSERSSDRSAYTSPRQQSDHSPRQPLNSESTRHPREHSPSWREIYQEVRRSMDDPLPVRRSLDNEFTLAPKQSPSQRANSSPPMLTTPPRSRSPERSRSPKPKSPPRSRLQRSKSPPMLRSSRTRSPQRPRSPDPRSPPRSRSPKARSPPRSRSPRARSPPRIRSRSPPVSRSYLERMTGDLSEAPPRAGVYSSPMPIRRGKSSQLKTSATAKPTTPPRNKEIYPLIVSPSMSEKRQSSVLQRELEDRHRELVEQQESFDTELYSSATMSDDVHLSSSTRVGLREKHAKHMADLREYYEKELQALRQALKASDSDTVSGHKSLQHLVSENESLHLEIGLQREKIIELEDKLNTSNRTNYEIEQKVKALEDRAVEYADFYKEAQGKISTFRCTVEELQYRIGEKDDLLEQLKAENNAHKNNLKKAKKVQEDQATYIHRDRTALEKLVEQFQANERERAILKESVNDLENKLYDARTENVEMKRITTKLELENKRLGRENDNLHHKISQGVSHNISGSIYNSLHESLGVQQEALALDHRHPSPARPSVRKPSPTRNQFENNSSYHTSSRRHPPSDSRTPSRTEPVSAPYVESNGVDNSVRQSQENILNGSFHRTEDTLTPPRNTRSRLEPERAEELLSVSSPVMRAEEELYRLRDVLRNSPTPSREPTQPKLQKKFYGSDVITQSRRTEMSPDRLSDSVKPKKKSASNSPLVKSSKHSKSDTTHSKTKSSSRRTTSGKDHSGKEDFSSQTRFDIHSDNQVTRSPGDGQPKPNGVVRTNRKPPGGDNSNASRTEDRKKKKVMKPLRGRSRTRSRSPSPCVRRRSSSLPRVPRPCRKGVEPAMTVDEMLDRVKAGDYLSRPDWEDKYTSMASKPKAAPASPRQPTSREDRIKDRLRSIGDMEHRYDDLNTEKRQLESALSRLPSHGKSRKKKEELEENLDRVERELGSVRMSLKRYNVLKSTI